MSLMTLIATRFASIQAGLGDPDDPHTATVDVDFAPMNAMVNISISRFEVATENGPASVGVAGILDYRIRNDQGVDVQTTFGDPTNILSASYDTFPVGVAHNNMTHITMALITFNSFIHGLMTVFGTDFAQDSDE
jgi:hypothetical protein